MVLTCIVTVKYNLTILWCLIFPLVLLFNALNSVYYSHVFIDKSRQHSTLLNKMLASLCDSSHLSLAYSVASLKVEGPCCCCHHRSPLTWLAFPHICMLQCCNPLTAVRPWPHACHELESWTEFPPQQSKCKGLCSDGFLYLLIAIYIVSIWGRIWAGHFCLLCFTLGKGYMALHAVASSVVTTHSCVVIKPLVINRRTENGSQTLVSLAE